MIDIKPSIFGKFDNPAGFYSVLSLQREYRKFSYKKQSAEASHLTQRQKEPVIRTVTESVLLKKQRENEEAGSTNYIREHFYVAVQNL